MPELNEVFNRLRETRKKKKSIQDVYRDALDQSKTYQEVVEQLQELKAKKLQLETTIKSDFEKEFAEMDRLKEHIESDQELLSDLALNQFVKGQTVEITDEHDTKYVPQFRVTFKKADQQ